MMRGDNPYCRVFAMEANKKFIMHDELIIIIQRVSGLNLSAFDGKIAMWSGLWI